MFDKLKKIFKKNDTKIAQYDSGNCRDTVSVEEKERRIESLSNREYEAYLILLEGYTLRYCAEQMGVKYPTANTYVNAIYRKLGVRSKAQLILNYRNIKQK